MEDVELDAIIEDVLDSVALALRSEGVAEVIIKSVTRTVKDYVGNHYF